MDIDLCYKKIPDTHNCPLKQCIGFEKYDGTNIHWVFVPGFGWTDYGTRRDRFQLNETGINQFEKAHPELSGVDKLWDQDGKLGSYLATKYNTAKEIVVFTEYYGPNSFAGSHDSKDKMELVIFDISIDNSIIYPKTFISDFVDFNIARVVFECKYTGQLFIDIRIGKYGVKEGVVIKGVVDNNVYMAKIKTEAYMERLKNKFKDSWVQYWE
jgi:hypothetical protein